MLSAAAFLSQPAAAQPDPAKDYPNKPVRFIVPFAPGAGTDLTARTIAQKLSEMWGQQVIADNRTGAKVPAPIVRKLSAAINEALKSPDITKRFAAEGSTPRGSTPEEFGKHIASEINKWRKLVKAANLQLGQ